MVPVLVHVARASRAAPPNETLKWTSAGIVEVIMVEWLARYADDQHVLAGESSLAA
jgi:hypothetical protein